jgi:hypothetical protein
MSWNNVVIVGDVVMMTISLSSALASDNVWIRLLNSVLFSFWLVILIVDLHKVL